MDTHEFDITIGKDGRVRAEIKGSRGKRCLALADLLQQIVGREESRELTSDYYQPDTKVRTDAQIRTRRAE